MGGPSVQEIQKQQLTRRIDALLKQVRADYITSGLGFADHLAAKDKARDELAGMIVDTICDDINAVVIRPGPKPEERECTAVAKELQAHRPQLVKKMAVFIR